MSLFDILRYPISDSPTVEQLKALPTELYREWLKSANFAPDRWDCNDVIWYFSVHPNHTAHDIKLLREMIEEYDESL